MGARRIARRAFRAAFVRPYPPGTYRRFDDLTATAKCCERHQFDAPDPLADRNPDAVPRESHGGWKAPSDRRDPVELLVESNKDRMPQLIPIRHGRMVQSPFAFYRGSAALMAADLARTPATGLRVQACGDAHLLNCVEQRIGKVSARTVVEHDFPKLVEQQGSTPLIKQPRSRLS